VDVTEFIANNPREVPLAAALNGFFQDAATEGLADLHLETVIDGSLILRVRTNGGVLAQRHRFERQDAQIVLNKIRQRANLSVIDALCAQDGRIVQEAMGRRLDVRVSIVPTLHGSSCVMRVLDSANAGMPIEKLRMPPKVQRAFERVINLPEGVILTVGPTGSGKTTTLYSALGRLNTPETKICTAENPVEYVLPGVNQTQAGAGSAVDFPSALRAFLRQDPDVILVGEIRDSDTAKTAMQAGQTGHLVLSTLHANDALETFTRLGELGVSGHVMRSAIKAVIAQRLVRRVCPNCVREVPLVDADALEVAHRHGDLRGIDHVGAGCDACHGTGTQGRQAIYEMVLLDRQLRAAMRDQDGDGASMREAAMHQAQYQTLSGAAAELAAQGIISYREVTRAVSEL
jgi:type II secretory ATPase GspE/PulE/Tfp pilus assembly ATPase PilB-like protein